MGTDFAVSKDITGRRRVDGENIMGTFLIALAVVVLLKLWDSKITINITSKRKNKRRKKHEAIKSEERNLLSAGNDEDIKLNNTKQLND